MNERQRRFADFYIETANATEAARRAGYKQAESKASQLLKLENVKVYVDERMKQLASARVAGMAEILEFLTAAMRGEVNEKYPVGGELVDKSPAVKERIRAAELLLRRYAAATSDADHNDAPIAAMLREWVGYDRD